MGAVWKEEFGMKFVEPIRDEENLEKMKKELLKRSYRDYMLFVIGINTGLRISDILALRVIDVKDCSHITIKEKKTGKQKKFLVNPYLRSEIDNYIANMADKDYLFRSRTGENHPISRVQAYRILNETASKLGISEIGTHTLRKSFGYHFYQRTKDIAILQKLFNHSSPSITLRYIGVNQDIIDDALEGFSL